MKTRTLLLSTSLLLAACGRGAGGEFESGLPTEQMVKLEVPESAGQGLTVGQQSDLYTLTRGVTWVVNGGTAAVLRLVRDVVRTPPTTLQEDVAVWGPHSEPLAKNAWRLTVTRVSEDVYTYTLEGKGKTEDDSAWRTVLSGTHTRARDAAGEVLEDFGSGTFTVDWDAAAQLPEHNANEMGKGIFTYARPAPGADVHVDVDFRQVRDAESGERIDADYRYAATAAAGGQFDFALWKDYVKDTAALERLSIRSRWQQTGAGRSDVRLAGGDVAGEAFVNECWDAGFVSRYARVSFAPMDDRVNYGTESSDCAIQGASYFTE